MSGADAPRLPVVEACPWLTRGHELLGTWWLGAATLLPFVAYAALRLIVLV